MSTKEKAARLYSRAAEVGVIIWVRPNADELAMPLRHDRADACAWGVAMSQGHTQQHTMQLRPVRY